MHYQVIIRTHSGNTIEGAILPGDAETAADKIDDMLAHNDTLAIEQAGFTAHALVPIEAEEEITRAWDSRKINSRLVTPWEEA